MLQILDEKLAPKKVNKRGSSWPRPGFLFEHFDSCWVECSLHNNVDCARFTVRLKCTAQSVLNSQEVFHSRFECFQILWPSFWFNKYAICYSENDVKLCRGSGLPHFVKCHLRKDWSMLIYICFNYTCSVGTLVGFITLYKVY